LTERSHDRKLEPRQHRVSALVRTLADQGPSPLSAYDFAKSVLRYAANHEPPLRAGNSAAAVKVKRNHRRPVACFLTDHEAGLLLPACDEAIASMIKLTLATGLRWGEVCGLRVRDLDLTGNRPALAVVQAVRRPQGGNGYSIGEPKSASSRRTVVLDPSTVDLLTEIVTGKAADDLIFPNPKTGEHWTSSAFTKAHWTPARDAAEAQGLTKRPRFHDLRHTHAAWLLTDGVPLLVVSRRLGHDSVAITASTYGYHTRMPTMPCWRRWLAIAPAEGGSPRKASGTARRANSERPLGTSPD
jgi:integrase